MQFSAVYLSSPQGSHAEIEDLVAVMDPIDDATILHLFEWKSADLCEEVNTVLDQG